MVEHQDSVRASAQPQLSPRSQLCPRPLSPPALSSAWAPVGRAWGLTRSFLDAAALLHQPALYLQT